MEGTFMFNFTNAFIKTDSGDTITIKPEIKPTEDGLKVTVYAKDIPTNSTCLELFPDMPIGKAGDDGYFLFPFQIATFLCTFKEVEDKENEYTLYSMPVYGFKQGDRAALCVVSSMAWENKIVLKSFNNTYYAFPRFDLTGHGAYEDIVVEYFYLNGKDADYNGMARRYRKYQRDRNVFKTLNEKIESRPSLKGVADSINIRVRMGWKPVPAQIHEQTIENEPPMKVAISFDRLCELIDGMKAAGIKKADFCLVGWNCKGHDGRWPQCLPVEETLGGEEGLKRAIKKAEEAGYTINAHTNSTAAYSIAECFNENEIIIKSNGEKSTAPFFWAGGRAYNVCPECAYKNSKVSLKEIQKLGFYGMHYIDVISTVMPKECFAKEHPVTKKQCIYYYNDLLKYAQNLFGGISSEGCHDFVIGSIDFGLYSCNRLVSPETDPFMDIKVPFSQLVYHDSVLSCPSGDTVNCTIGKREKLLKVVEFGGRPIVYIHQQFFNNGEDFMGKGNLTCDTDEDLKTTIKAIKDAEELYNALEPIRYSTMINHKKLADGVFKTEYENGAYTIVNYTDKDFVYDDIVVKAEDFIVL